MKHIKIIVIDSGADINHPIFNNYSIKTYIYNKILISDTDTPKDAHGTAICGIIAKEFPKSEIISIRPLCESSDYNETHLINILKYIYENLEAHIINLSLGINICHLYHELYNICNKLKEKGVIIISAFDNSGAISYPAAFDNVIGVASDNNCTECNDFGYIEKDFVNIVAKGTPQRVAWINPQYMMLGGGNSIACAHVTAQTAKYMNSRILGYDDILKAFCSKSKFTYKNSNLSKNQKPLFHISNAALFPFNKEMHSLIRFSDTLSFKIVDIYDTKYSGTVGSSTTLLLNDNFIPSFTIKNINDINWNNFDTLIIGHLGELSNLIDKDNLLRSIMLTAKKHNKNLFLFDDVSKYDIFDHYTMYVPRVCKEDVNNNYLGMLYYISKPVLGIFGTSSRQGKFTLQITLRNLFINSGYKVGQIGTEPSSTLFGMDEAYPIGYNSSVYINGKDAIVYLNSVLNNLCNKNDIIIVGSQSGTIPYDIGNLCQYTLSQHEFISATQPDVAVLCINPYDDKNYIKRTITYIEATADCKVIALVVFPMSFPENWLGYFGKKIKIKENDFNKIKKCYENEFKINVYKLGDDKDIQKLYENIINYLS